MQTSCIFEWQNTMIFGSLAVLDLYVRLSCWKCVFYSTNKFLQKCLVGSGRLNAFNCKSWSAQAKSIVYTVSQINAWVIKESEKARIQIQLFNQGICGFFFVRYFFKEISSLLYLLPYLFAIFCVYSSLALSLSF